MKYYEANNELPGKLKFKVNYYLLKVFLASFQTKAALGIALSDVMRLLKTLLL